MFEIGEYVVCGAKGVCQIRDITHIDMSGADKEKLYYVLAPVGDKNGTIYVPTDSEKIIMRRTISKEEAERLIDELPQIELLWVPDDKQREETYSLGSELSLTLGVPREKMEDYIRERLS